MLFVCFDILVQQSLQLVAAVSGVVSGGTPVPDNFVIHITFCPTSESHCGTMASHLMPEPQWLSSRSSINVASEDGTEIIEDGQNTSQHKLFACPYLKRDPFDYAERVSCSSSGWKTVHGVR